MVAKTVNTMQQAVAQALRSALGALVAIGDELDIVQGELDDAGTVRSSEIGSIKDSLAAAERAVLKSAQALRKELLRYAKGLEWELITVALHGETNAGKSAIIEALTQGNGAWVGDGRKDHTERLQSKHWNRVILLDTPGIEGKEGSLLQEVQQALGTAHIVLIVLPDKEPEEGTLRKIRQHARRASHVFSVLNQGGRPTTYRHRKQLIDLDAERQGVRIRSKLAATFGDNYRGHLTVNALLALLSHGAELRDRFLSDRQKTIEIFGTLAAAREFSGLPILESTLQNARREARRIILSSNLHRVTGVLDEVRQHLLHSHQALNRGAALWRESIAEIRPMIERLMHQAKHSIELRIDSDLRALTVELKELLRDGINEGTEWGVMKARMRDSIRTASENLAAKLRAEFEQLESDVLRCLNRLSTRLHLYIDLEPSLADIGSVLADMAQVGAREVLDLLLSAAGSALAWTLNPIVGLVSVVLTGLRKLWEWRGGGRDRRLRDQMAKANRAVDASLAKLRNQQVSQFNKSWRTFAVEVGNEISRVAAVGETLGTSSLKFKQRAIVLQRERAELESLFAQAAQSNRQG